MGRLDEGLKHDTILKWATHIGDKNNDTGDLLLSAKSATHVSLHFGTTVLQTKREGRRETESSSYNCLAFVPYELPDQPAELMFWRLRGSQRFTGTGKLLASR